MAVTKRTRFEVLRRDEHTCQYCGAKAPDVTLQIDHVVPVTLGGNDKPENLVAACKDCNSGKTSIAPDAPIVQKLSAEASAYALGMLDKMTRLRADVERADEFIERFEDAWSGWTNKATGEKIPLPPDYEMSLFKWAQMGIPSRVVEMAIPKAMVRTGLRGEYAEFQYFAGIVWRVFSEREIDYTVTDDTAAIYTESEMHNIRVDAYETGDQRGWSAMYEWMRVAGRLPIQDFVTAHIDHRSSVYIEEYREGGIAPWQESTHKSDSTSGTTMTSEF